jgi:trimethylguanosine synthase
VTPEAVASYVARRVGGEDRVVLDGFCGAGGDSIQLARCCKAVIANDLDPAKLELLGNNLAIYGVSNVSTSNYDFLELPLPSEQVNLVYMSPPWGGPDYFQHRAIRPQDMKPPLGAVLRKAFSIAGSVALLLSANMDLEALA